MAPDRLQLWTELVADYPAAFKTDNETWASRLAELRTYLVSLRTLEPMTASRELTKWTNQQRSWALNGRLPARRKRDWNELVMEFPEELAEKSKIWWMHLCRLRRFMRVTGRRPCSCKFDLRRIYAESMPREDAASAMAAKLWLGRWLHRQLWNQRQGYMSPCHIPEWQEFMRSMLLRVDQ